jgi:hypothetical protein
MRACEQGGATSQTIEFDFDYTRWVGQSVRSLPYFDKLHRYFDALKRGWDGSWSLEVEGRTILSGTTGDIGQSAVVSEEYAKLDYIRCVRELLELWKIDVPMLDVPVSWREISMVCKLWSLLCELPRKRNAELSSGNLVILVGDVHEAEGLRNSVASSQPGPVSLQGNSTIYLTCWGQR